jgi:hypothetical protein
MMTTQERLKRGTVREDGMVFWCYKGEKEYWVSPGQVETLRKATVLSSRKYFEANPEKSRESWRASELKHREKRRIKYAGKWAEYRARPDVKIAMAAWRRNRRQTNPAFKIATVLRTRMYGVLAGLRKSAPTVKLLGCSLEDFKKYLEARFLPGMSWENHGAKGWHVDHVIPCAAFDLTDPEQQKICFHHTNLQPLWARDNLRKSASLPGWLS